MIAVRALVALALLALIAWGSTLALVALLALMFVMTEVQAYFVAKLVWRLQLIDHWLHEKSSGRAEPPPEPPR